ncbi:Sodium/hydrogen exchanger family-domain-containing protein [Endogone sp. FLAS-F59071]|nr:Sodium/hydrogen exchanger family-domain-containing protein [Endogone sp. FLAS-F59071]|eukprot:RUS17420.1 Sodium/hydrogen exchanger family-domain-containing protein [Endogone sp. FLAS-F59071]
MSGNKTNNTGDPGDIFEGQPVEEEFYSSWALLILTTLLIGALWTSYYLQLKQIRAIHETVVSIVGGMLVGLALKLSPGHIIQKMVTFNQGYFFNLLLPPIILNSGYELKRVGWEWLHGNIVGRKMDGDHDLILLSTYLICTNFVFFQQNFFRNFGTILTFALAGTFITAIVTGIFVFIYAAIGLESLHIGFLDSMIFGSILSATDPVTILAIFSQLKVDPKLYSIIFGESILNDAVAIVLSSTLVEFRGQELHISNIVRGIGMFFGGFTGSLGIGIMFGLAVALMLKYSQLYRYPNIETCLIGLMAYSSYLFSNGISMSGIVSLLFCGITLKHYAYDNMSLRARRTTKYMFQVLAQLSENFIFIYLGVNLFTQTDLVYQPFFIFFTTVGICFIMSSFCHFDSKRGGSDGGGSDGGELLGGLWSRLNSIEGDKITYSNV